MKNPKVTIILPVYNVEQYLRQCLDSIVNQTMRDIQVICINDGSTDGSLSILREYEASDSRITVLDQPNQGQAIARNVAYPLIKSKYTMFVDSDDWIELDTCEKLFDKAEQTNTEIVVFFYLRENGDNTVEPLSPFISPGTKTTPQDKASILFYHTSACWKFWRSDFLLDNNLVFPEGLIYEDNMVHWKAVTQARHIEVFPKPFYHYRNNPNSTTQAYHRHSEIVLVFHLILAYLHESGLYQDYKDIFILQKLQLWHYYYSSAPEGRLKFLQWIRQSLTKDDRKYYHTNPEGRLSHEEYLFYCMNVEKNKAVILKHHLLYKPMNDLRELLKWPERVLLRRFIFKPMKRLLGIKKIRKTSGDNTQ